MELTVKNVKRGLKDYPSICRLMTTAFPREEQIPMWLLRLYTLKKGVEFRAFYDEEQFCGVSYTIENEKYLFVLFLAVNDAIRSKGYGSRILQWLGSNSAGAIALNVERPEPSAPNYAQRVKRVEFYCRNGITDTGYEIQQGAQRLTVLSSDSHSFDVDRYSAVIERVFPGEYKDKITKRN